MKEASRTRKAVLVLLAALALFTAAACNRDPAPNDGSPDRGSDLLRATDAKTLTLQLADLPEGATEAGSVLEITPENLEQLKAEAEIDGGTYDRLKDLDFKTVATRTFSVGDDGKVDSTVAVFESVEDAQTYFASGAPAAVLEEAPELGDDSFSERTKNSPGNEPTGERVVDSETVHTRVRIANVVIDVSQTDDPSELDVEDAFELARIAANRVENA